MISKGARIKVIFDGKLDVSDFVGSVEWSGHSERPYRQLSLSMNNTVNGRTQAIAIDNGKQIDFYDNDELLFRGIIFSHDVAANGSHSVQVYDENYYLLKSTDTRRFSNTKASDIIRKLCKDFGIPVGSIADTGYVIPKLILKQKTLDEMIKYALEVTRKQTGKRYLLQNINGKLSLVQFTAKQSQWMLEAGYNITGATYSKSIEDTKTQVKVIGGKDNSIVSTVKNDSLIKKYGVMQHLETMDGESSSSQVKQRAEQLMKELAVINDQANVEALGINEIVTGMGVYVREPMTKIIGGYFVIGDSHSYSNGVHTMSLEISATYELPPIEIEKEALGIEE